jgi:UDP-N-acetylmuramoyl-tripeptide--D-alanyl-D-alanine ligase
MPAATKYAVIEIGMNHAGEIAPLTKLAKPTVAIVLNVLPAHLGHFDSLEGIAKEKASIFEGLVEGGVAIFKDMPEHDAVMRAATESSSATSSIFGSTSLRDFDARVTFDRDFDDDPEAAIVLKHGSEEIVVRCPLPAPGQHIAENAGAVVLAVRACGIADVQSAVQTLRGVPVPSGRGDRITLQVAGGTILLIDESYNANPGSMTAALREARSEARAEANRLILVLGDMLELGEYAQAFHRSLAKNITTYANSLVFVCGPHMSAMLRGLPSVQQGGASDTAAALIPLVTAALRPGDVVMVKGSNGSKVWQVAHALKALAKT